ncbi:MAG: GNAT family N-acetyltransferase [Bacteroidia bacterium]
MRLRERPLFFRWATRSDATPFWYGERYGDEVPSYIVFKMDWPDYYFEDIRPEDGRCFAIEHNGRAIGQVNYNAISRVDRTTELDILIASEQDQGQGFGTDAIRTLTRYLFDEMGVRRCRIEVVPTNPRAVHAYAKAGFEATYTYVREHISWIVMECLATQPLAVR